MLINMAGASDRGLRRLTNQDYLLFDQALGLGVVADGVGGVEGGELAARFSCQTVFNFLADRLKNSDKDLAYLSLMQQAVCLADVDIKKQQKVSVEFKEMATTLNVLLFSDNKLYLAHIGDTRTYLLEENHFSCLTEDHNLLNYILNNKIQDNFPKSIEKRALIRALGMEECTVDLFSCPLKENQIFVTATDGLYEMVSEENIVAILTEKNSLAQKVEKLVEQANENGGKDNITVFLSQIISL